MKLLSGFISLLFIIACNPKPNPTVVPKYFDVPAYFKSEAARLGSDLVKVEKTLHREGKDETLISGNTEWMDEFRPFLDVNLNKPALVNAYSVDTTQVDGKVKIHYAAKDSAASTRSLFISMNENHPDTIIIINYVTNYYYTAKETLSYYPETGYYLSVYNKPVAGKETTFTMQGIFQK